MAYFLALILIILIIWYFWPQNKINFDKAATTHLHPSLSSRFNFLNPSAYYAFESKNLLSRFKAEILKRTGKAENHDVVITSCASESNALILGSLKNYDLQVSCFEHKSSLNYGKVVRPENFAFGPNKAISLMYMNNETGDIFPLKEIAQKCKNTGTLLHTDASQYFGKSQPSDFENIDFITISFHKMNGPHISALVILKDFHLEPMIKGTQQAGMRGGTENMPYVDLALKGMEITFQNRLAKNQKLICLKEKLLNVFRKYCVEEDLENYMSGKPFEIAKIPRGKKYSFVQISKNSMNILLVAFIYKPSGFAEIQQRFCNIEFRKKLAECGVYISIGSACNTNQKSASHVLHALNLPFIIRCGTCRFSFDDYNYEGEIDKFEKIFKKIMI